MNPTRRTKSVTYKGWSPITSHRIALVVLWALMFSSHASAQTSGSAEYSAASSKFAELSDQFMKESLALSPTDASAAGYHRHLDRKTGKTVELDALLDELSLGSIGEQREFYRGWRD